MSQDEAYEKIRESLSQERETIKTRESLLLKIKEIWMHDPDFREQLRKFVKEQPSSDSPGRKTNIDPERIEGLIKISSKLGVKKAKTLDSISEIYDIKKESIARSLRPSRKGIIKRT
jgi:hypothetical protein